MAIYVVTPSVEMPAQHWLAGHGMTLKPYLRDRDFAGANLSGQDLERANLIGVSLAGAYLAGANLRAADLRGANLSGADLTNANLSTARLDGANLANAHLDGANLHLASLRAARLEGAALSGADLSEAAIFNVDLRGVDVSRANLDRALMGETIVSRVQYRLLGALGAHRHGVIIQEDQLGDPSAERTASVRAFLALANGIEGVNLSGMDLSGVDLSGIDLAGTCLKGACLRGSILSRADLSGARLDGADLTGALLDSSKLDHACLAGANLAGADLLDATLAGANLEGANLSRAILRRVRLDGANLRKADLTGARLNSAYFISVDFEGAVLEPSQLASTAEPTFKTVRCPFCLRQGVLREYYVCDGKGNRVVTENSDAEVLWPCGHASLAAYRLYFYRTQADGRPWLREIGLRYLEPSDPIWSQQAADLKASGEGKPQGPSLAQIEACFDRHFEVRKTARKYSWCAPPSTTCVVAFAADPATALRLGWADVLHLLEGLANPHSPATRNWGWFESARDQMLATAAYGARG